MEEPPIPLQVSVLIVSYNCPAALRACLTSLEASADRDKMEVLVVDSGSFDRTPEVVADFPQTILLKLPRNFGFTRALNIAMRTAKAEFYFFLSPHVLVLPDTVSALAARLAAEPDATAVCPLLVTADGQPSPQFYRLPGRSTVSAIARAAAFAPAAPPFITEEKVSVEFPTFSALMVRGYFLKGLRYIDERYAQSWADAELALQIRRAAKKILLFPAILATRSDDDPPPSPLSPAQRALLASDWASGAAVYAGKHFGFAARFKLRLAAIFSALGAALLALLRFRDVHYHFSRFLNVAAGAKVDGTQGIM
jgi:glycosyltransferase involved in cell wall biosynthesis